MAKKRGARKGRRCRRYKKTPKGRRCASYGGKKARKRRRKR